MAEELNEKVKELIKKFSIDIEKLKQEQIKLAKTLKLKDSIDFSSINRIGGCANAYFNNHIVSAIAVFDENLELIEEKYCEEKLKFPYLPGFRSYRELPAMVSCFNKLEERPDVIFVAGHGISAPILGLASHFSLSTGIPTIGIAQELVAGEIKDKKIYINEKVVGEEILTKQGSNPIFISPGNLISRETAIKLVKQFILPPHKLPKPLVLARKYAKTIAKELNPKKSADSGQ